MPKLIMIIWMTILWLIAVVAGATFYYGVNTGLGTLAMVALILAFLAFGASLLPLSTSFLSEFGLTTRSSYQEVPRAQPPAAGIVHEAGAPAGDHQACLRCGAVLCDFSAPGASRTGWAAGTRLVETNGVFSSIDGKVAEESFCSPIRNRLWSVPS